MSVEDTVKSFMSLGLSEQKAKETLKNASVTKTLQAILHEVRIFEFLYHIKYCTVDFRYVAL